MHYSGSKDVCIMDLVNKTPYMTVRSTGQKIWDNKVLSDLDIAALNRFYAAPDMSPCEIQPIKQV